MEYKTVKDTLGSIEVPKDVYWGAQTQRSLKYFNIGNEKIPIEILQAYGYIKKAAAIVNKESKLLESKKADAIIKASDELLSGKLNNNFPLSVWQTGSGTHTHMNINEVLANRATELLAYKYKVDPHDDLNISQSSNDTFPTALHIAITLSIKNHLLPTLEALQNSFKKKSEEFKDIIKIGRTHLQDAVPLSFGQEISGWTEMINKNSSMIIKALEPVKELAIGGSAIGTGLNTLEGFDKNITMVISKLTGEEFTPAPNKFHALSSHDTLVALHGTLKALSSNMIKIANDIRWLSSGPRTGLGEITVPINEAGSSIMPGKTNPTQAEAVIMAATQVMGNDTTIAIAASGGNFQLNLFQPLIGYNFLQSIILLNDSIDSFNKNCIIGIVPNLERLNENLQTSLMIATALNPYIGYDKATFVVQEALKHNTSIKEQVLKHKLLNSEEFDKYVNIKKLIYPKNKFID